MTTNYIKTRKRTKSEEKEEQARPFSNATIYILSRK